MRNERYDYIDCCRGMLSVLIIVFHIWGIFNAYVSSFVVASFFILSGYISNADKYSFRDFAKKKIYGLLVPYIVVNTGYYFAYWFLESICLEIICPIPIEKGTGLIKYWINVLDFPTNGGWFTTSWFIWVLFWIVIFDKGCKCVFKGKSIWIYWCILLGMLGVVQVSVINNGNYWFAYGDLIIIGCLFYNLGDILKRFNILEKMYMIVKTPQFLWRFVITILAISYVLCQLIPELAVDWPLRQFGNIGIHLVYTTVLFSAVYVSARRISEINKGLFLTHLGRIAMPVLLLQFLIFQFVQVFEIMIGVKDKSLLPSLSIATYSRWDWVFYTCITCIAITELDKRCRKSRLYRVCICGSK